MTLKCVTPSLCQVMLDWPCCTGIEALGSLRECLGSAQYAMQRLEDHGFITAAKIMKGRSQSTVRVFHGKI